MTEGPVTFRDCRVFDGHQLFGAAALRVEKGLVTSVGPVDDVPCDGEIVELGGDILSPGYVDLQVNGGDGVMLNDDPSPDTLSRIVSAHRRLGVAACLPTLITDTPHKTKAAIDAVIEAAASGMRGIAGLHLEGPHLSIARKGAHDPALIRPMEQGDLEILLHAAASLPVLKVTVAPENVTEDQVSRLAQAGVVVSLGHTDADFETCCRYFAAGARCTTHLFNAMSQLGSREPGLVGAALATGSASAGIIADAVHVHPASIRAAWAAKTGPGRIFLVSDAMAVAGTTLESFELGGRRITRENGILTLGDGTLAGADLDMTTAIRTLVEKVGIGLEDALCAAIESPADMIRLKTARLVAGSSASNLIRISANLDSVGTVA